MHELDEVFLPDIPRPIKREMTWWKELSERHMIAGAKAFSLQYPFDAGIKYIDAAALHAEMFDVMSKPPKPWGELPPRLKQTILPMTWQDAEQNFKNRFYELRS